MPCPRVHRSTESTTVTRATWRRSSPKYTSRMLRTSSWLTGKFQIGEIPIVKLRTPNLVETRNCLAEQRTRSSAQWLVQASVAINQRGATKGTCFRVECSSFCSGLGRIPQDLVLLRAVKSSCAKLAITVFLPVKVQQSPTMTYEAVSPPHNCTQAFGLHFASLCMPPFSCDDSPQRNIPPDCPLVAGTRSGRSTRRSSDR